MLSQNPASGNNGTCMIVGWKFKPFYLFIFFIAFKEYLNRIFVNQDYEVNPSLTLILFIFVHKKTLFTVSSRYIHYKKVKSFSINLVVILVLIHNTIYLLLRNILKVLVYVKCIYIIILFMKVLQEWISCILDIISIDCWPDIILCNINIFNIFSKQKT